MPIEQITQKSIIQKLDLDHYIEQFKYFLAREKPVAMMGDINQHYRYIKALSAVQFTITLWVNHTLRGKIIKHFHHLFWYFNTLYPCDKWFGKAHST